MRLILLIIYFSVAFVATKADALSVSAAQVCANELLNAYNERRFPGQFLAIEALTSRAFGSGFKSLNQSEKETAIEATTRVLRDSFENPTGKYRYRDLVVAFVEKTKQGNFRIIGEVHITSPMYTGYGSFLALTSGSCQIFQVRIEDVATLDGQLRQMLRNDSVARKLLEKIED